MVTRQLAVIAVISAGAFVNYFIFFRAHDLTVQRMRQHQRQIHQELSDAAERREQRRAWFRQRLDEYEEELQSERSDLLAAGRKPVWQSSEGRAE